MGECINGYSHSYIYWYRGSEYYCFILVIYWYRNKMLSQYNNFLNKADEILGGKQLDMIYDLSLIHI